MLFEHRKYYVMIRKLPDRWTNLEEDTQNKYLIWMLSIKLTLTNACLLTAADCWHHQHDQTNKYACVQAAGRPPSMVCHCGKYPQPWAIEDKNNGRSRLAHSSFQLIIRFTSHHKPMIADLRDIDVLSIKRQNQYSNSEWALLQITQKSSSMSSFTTHLAFEFGKFLSTNYFF